MKLFVVCGLAAGCTTLGPMPATTGVSAVPAARVGVEAQVGLMPAFFLSQSAQDKGRGTVTPQLSLLVDPDTLLHLPGLIGGLRVWGETNDRPAEPYLGYRALISDSVAVAGVAYGTVARGVDHGASYRSVRVGGELIADARIGEPTGWLALHVQLTASATAISATGSYCTDSSGIAVDCDQDGPSTLIDGKLSGLFPAGTAGLALDIAQLPHSWFHGARVAASIAGGQMPLMRGGVQGSRALYSSLALSLTLGFGEQ